MTALAVEVGGVHLKNPHVCGTGEPLIEPAGLRAALDAGAAAVVLKSTNESDAAKRQLDRTDYVLLDSAWRRLDWNFAPPRDASLLCRSGLSPLPFDEWLGVLRDSDRYARQHDAVVVASLIPADAAIAAALAKRMVEAGARILELNIGAPHGAEAAPGAITLERDAERVRDLTGLIRRQVAVPLWVKLTGQSGDVAGLAAAAFAGGAHAVGLMGRFMALLPDPETMAPVLNTRAAFGGAWALPLTCYWLAAIRERLGRGRPLIGTNGARDGLDVVRMMLAGAHAVELTSAVFTNGPEVIREAVAAISEYAQRHQVPIADIIGRAADRVERYDQQPLRAGYWRSFGHPNAR